MIIFICEKCFYEIEKAHLKFGLTNFKGKSVFCFRCENMVPLATLYNTERLKEKNAKS